MSKTNIIVLVIVIAVVGVIVGLGLGMMLQKQADAPKVSKFAAYETAVKALSSKAVPSIIAYGQVSNIEGRKVTLNYSGETLVVDVAQNANVYALTPAAGAKAPTAPVQRKALFTEVKKGDNLNITLKLSSDGKIEGQSVIILTSTGK